MIAAIFRVVLATTPRDFRTAYASSLERDFAEELSSRPSAVSRLGYAASATGDLIITAIDERTANFRRDLAFAIRSILKTPGIAAVIIATLALAIGANTAVFSVLRAVVLQPLPYPDSDRIVVLSGLKDGAPFGLSLPDFADAHRATQTLAKAAVLVDYSEEHVLEGHGELRSVTLATVTPQYFDVFGIPPQVGRYFEDRDARTGGRVPIIVSEHLWRTALQSDRNVVGSILRLEDVPYRVVGIAPARLSAPGISAAHFDAWRVMSESDSAAGFYNRNAHMFSGIARLRGDATLAGARADLDRTFAGLRAKYADDRHYSVSAGRFIDDVVGNIRPTLVAIFIAVAGVLAIACANVANLMLGRANARERELTVRLALGASRRRIVTQILTEAFAFAVVGGTLGVLIAIAAVGAFVASRPSFVPRIEDVHVEGMTLLYTATIVIVTTVVSGIVPALTFARRDLAGALKMSGRSGDASAGERGRAALVVFEIAATLALVVVAGLVVRSYASLTSRPIGFDASNVAIVGPIQTSGSRYNSEERKAAFYRKTRARARAIPGVVDAAWSFAAPFVPVQWNQSFEIFGEPTPVGAVPSARMNSIDDAYFAVLGIPLRAGRTFDARDRATTSPSIVVNEAFVRTYLSRRAPLGTKLLLGGSSNRTKPRVYATIVGVVADARGSYATAALPTIFPALAQSPPYIAELLVKTRPGVAVDTALANIVSDVDPRFVRPEIASMTATMAQSAARTRLTMQTLVALAAIALILALSGIFAVVSYGVSQRTREFGIRMALGARPATIRGDVIARAMRVAAIGIALGVIGAGFASRALTITLFDIEAIDPITFGCVIALVTVSVLVAALVPAWRATRVDPAIALRYE